MRLKGIERQVGESRILRLFSLARERAIKGTDKDMKLSGRYMSIAMRISRHYKIKLPDAVKRGMCPGCGMILIPGKNCSVRISGKAALYRCLKCGSIMKVFAT